MPEYEIICGDCLEVMRTIPDNCIDSIVSDPPYGISFMGKKWDYDVPSVEVWKEVLRVLKPGGHALIACGTRTQHRMAVNIEDAGFEIRDIVAWVYGSGFPKSLNIGKAIDKLQGNEREVVGIKNVMNMRGGAFMEAKPHEDIPVTTGNTQWEGFGTALKPAMELWTLARKPLGEKTVAENVLKYGTGGINIDGCRIEFSGNGDEEEMRAANERRKKSNNETGVYKGVFMASKELKPNNSQGRFPANLIHDGSDEVVGLFPETNPSKASANRNGKNSPSLMKKGFEGKDVSIFGGHNDNGGSAARFFYTAKASKAERNAGCEGMEEKRSGSMMGCIDDGNFLTGSGNPRQGRNHNHHPTVKPLALMRYLCRLITPPKGIVLDCYAGSGSTLIAAYQEGFDCLGIEKEAEYVEIARNRIEKATQERRSI